MKNIEKADADAGRSKLFKGEKVRVPAPVLGTDR